MEDENLYDEFGNYIGPEIDVSGDDSGSDEDSGARSDYAYEKAVSVGRPISGAPFKAADQKLG